jgi:hypothetical protein
VNRTMNNLGIGDRLYISGELHYDTMRVANVTKKLTC